MKKPILIAAVALVWSTAFAGQPVDNSVARLIEGRDYGAAQAALDARMLRSHDDARSLLNMAFLMKATDRWDEAKGVYERVLAAPDVMVTTNMGRTLSAHDVARAGLGTGSVTVASR